MHLVILSNEALRNELLAQDTEPDLQITWIAEVNELVTAESADAVLDLLFEPVDERVQLLQRLAKPVIINSVIHPLSETDASFVRINGWPTFLDGTLVEAAALQDEVKELTAAIFQKLGKSVCWVPDQAGFLAPRVIASIINEGYFALSESVSTKEEIDTAMKLGTNYPYGPFEWSRQIGLDNVKALLEKLSEEEKRYQPSELLVKEAGL